MMLNKCHATALSIVFSIAVVLFLPLEAVGSVESAVHLATHKSNERAYRAVHSHPNHPKGHHPPRLSGHAAHTARAPYCGTDISSEQARTNLAAFHKARSSGTLTAFRAGKSGAPPTIGEEQSFNVSENNSWMSLDFRLVDIQEGVYYLWVEIAERDNGNVTDAEIEGLRDVLLESTPTRSINPSTGILENNHAIFGDAPNVDGDGIVDLLMYDIGRGSGSTLGYVATTDLNLNAPDGQGNRRDVLYLDSAEGTTNLGGMAAIAAHEYTHLIHANYDWDETFITEGYAEYAMVMNGYFWRGIEYLDERSELYLPLFTWRDSGGPVTRDYQRGGLFFSYIAEQTRPEVIGRMLRSEFFKGAYGIGEILKDEGSSLGDQIVGFHTANRFNDTSIRDDFGYHAPARASIPNAVLNLDPIDGEEEYVNAEDPYVSDFTASGGSYTIAGGAVKYYQWTDVADIQLAYDTPEYRRLEGSYRDQVQSSLYARNRIRLVLEPHEGGAPLIQDVDPAPRVVRVDGAFDTVTMIVANLAPGLKEEGDDLAIRFSWTPLSQAVPVEDADVLPAGVRLAQNYPNPFNPSTTIPVELSETGPVRLEVFDVLGRRVALLADGTFPAGEHRFTVRSNSWPSGQYLVRLVAGNVVKTRQMTLLK